jgi:hypothetical protein
MSGSQPTNNQAVQFEQQQAAEADAKDALRQQNLTQGQAAINALFDPQPVMETTTQNYDWSKFNPTAARGYTPYVAGQPAAGFGTTYSDASLPTGYTATSATTVQGPDGKTYSKGQPISYTTQTPTGQTTGGFGDDFYNNYKNAYLNYYMPDEARQYSEAQRDLTYNLARAGTLNSSTAADKAGDLAYNDANARATIQANANNAVGQLQSSVQGQKQDLINQLYSTEDPTLTANLAQSAANATKLATPTLTPAAALFTPALTAAGAAASSYLSPYSAYTGTPYTGIATGPTPASANANSGVKSNYS